MDRLISSLLLLSILPGHGIIFADGDDPAENKETAPTGAYLNSGWQHLLRFKNFQATMISPKHFITATHLGNSSGTIIQPMHFNGVANRSFTIKPDSRIILQANGQNSDLSVFEIWETFDNYAPLYTETDEAGQEFVLTGKGRGQGTALTRNGDTVGWEWGDPTTEFDRWGVSTVLSTTTSNGSDLIYSQFDASGGPHECQATGNDSGGGWFIKDGPAWKLAAVTFSADASRDSNDTIGDNSQFRAAMTRARGFYLGSDANGWNLIPTNNNLYNNPSQFETNTNDLRFYDKTHSFGTRISSFISDLDPIIQPAITLAALSPEARLTAWLNAQGITTETGPHDDADSDGLSNLLEYYSDSDPGNFSQSTPPLTTTFLPSGITQFTLTESLDLSARGLTGELQQSSDLDTWSPVTTATETSSSVDDTTGIRTRILQLPPSTDTEVFFRFRVTL